MKNFTLDDYSAFSRAERKWLDELFPGMGEELLSPSDDAVNAVLNYSKSTTHGRIPGMEGEVQHWN